MKPLAIALALCVALAPLAARAETVALEKGTAAPFNGLLLPEARFLKLLDAELHLDEATRKLEIERRVTIDLQAMYNTKLTEASKPIPWHETANFNRWLGFGIGMVIGVAVTALAVYASARLLEIRSNGVTTPR